MPSIAPAFGEKICCADVQDDALVLPCFVARDVHPTAVPSDLLTRRRAMVSAVHLQRTTENTSRVVVVAASRIPFSPRRQGFPTERHNNLLAPIAIVRFKPALLNSASLAIEAKLPGAV